MAERSVVGVPTLVNIVVLPGLRSVFPPMGVCLANKLVWDGPNSEVIHV